MKSRSFLLMLCLVLSASRAPAQPATLSEEPAHQELRLLRTNVLEAITKGDIQTVLGHLHTNVVITWQNGEVCRGHLGVKEFFERMGKQAFRGYKVPPTPDELTILYGNDTGVVFGHSVGQYSLFGRSFEFTNRWTATVVKENSRWLLAGYHVSLNALDNPILNAAKKSLFMSGGICAVIGLLLGFLLGKKIKRAPSANPSK